MSFLILHLHTIVILRMYPIYNPKHEGSKLLHDCHVLPQYPVTLRVQAHAHARIFAWLLGTCISETTADIAGNQTSMPEDQRELYTMQTTSDKVSQRQRHRGG